MAAILPKDPDAERSASSPMLSPTRLHVVRPEGAATRPPAAPPAARGVMGEKPAARKPVAVVVVHGMGQQVRFETLDLVVEGMKKAGPRDDLRAPKKKMEPREVQRKGVRRVSFKDAQGKDRALERVELDVWKKDHEKDKREAHVYEAYWAPLTEGRVGLKDVLAFVVRGAFNGLLKSVDDMSRWTFGKRRGLPRSGLLTLALVGVIALLAALVTVFLVATAFFADDRGWLGGLDADRYGNLAWVAAALAATLVLYVAMLGLAAKLPRGDPKKLHLRKVPVWLARLSLYAAGLCLLAFLAFLGAYLAGWSPSRPWPEMPAWGSTLVWGAFVGLALGARWWVVQFIGDVAAYVSSHKLDRFQELRDQIKARVGEVVQTVYFARDPDTDERVYDEVILVGHSLGSVAAYDALNAVVSEERLAPPSGPTAAQRTKLLLTFGSPLDKIAFFFTAQARKTSDTREELAALVQPLIQSYDHRPRAWVNVHAKPDVLGGAVDWYDPPETDPAYDKAKAVRNEADDDCDLPLMAHTQFWTTSRVWLHLGEALAP